MDDFLVEKLDLMIKRITGRGRDDVLLIVDGYEGQGKTTMSVQIAYYVAWKTGRPFSEKNVFFDVEEFMKFAGETKEQVLIWDEAALGGLSTQWYSKTQIKLTQLLQTFRKKRHFIIFNVPRIYRLNERLAYDRPLALIHVYSYKNIRKGYFCYYPQSQLEKLFLLWKYKKKSAYKLVTYKNGTFTKTFEELIDVDAYDKKKDKAILGVVYDNKLTRREEMHIKRARELKKRIANLKINDLQKKQLIEQLGITKKTLYDWADLEV